MISLPSFAKLNIGLEIIDKRPDGYHEIRTIFQTIDLHDTLTFENDDSISVRCNHPDIPGGSDNLAYKAAEKLRQVTGCKEGIRIDIRKRTPCEAGLGGGSSNAAVTLITLNRIWDLNLSPESLMKIGGSIGADVPFFIRGGTALGTGRGDEIEMLDDISSSSIILAVPGIRILTSSAYKKAFGLLTSEARPNNITAFIEGEKGIGSLKNDFENFLFAECPILDCITDSLIKLGARKAGATGSGSALFGWFDDSVNIEANKNILEKDFKTTKFLVTTTVSRVDYQKALML